MTDLANTAHQHQAPVRRGQFDTVNCKEPGCAYEATNRLGVYANLCDHHARLKKASVSQAIRDGIQAKRDGRSPVLASSQPVRVAAASSQPVRVAAANGAQAEALAPGHYEQAAQTLVDAGRTLDQALHQLRHDKALAQEAMNAWKQQLRQLCEGP